MATSAHQRWSLLSRPNQPVALRTKVQKINHLAIGAIVSVVDGGLSWDVVLLTGSGGSRLVCAVRCRSVLAGIAILVLCP